MQKVLIGVGTNLGTRQAHIERALRALQALPQTNLRACSKWYYNPPLGLQHQGYYLNGAALLETTLTANRLLQSLKNVEKCIGRKQKRKRWGPRVIDLDILLFGEQLLNHRHLKIPHPQVWVRDFTLIPLMDLHENLPMIWQPSVHAAKAKLSQIKLNQTPFTPAKRNHWRP